MLQPGRQGSCDKWRQPNASVGYYSVVMLTKLLFPKPMLAGAVFTAPGRAVLNGTTSVIMLMLLAVGHYILES